MAAKVQRSDSIHSMLVVSLPAASAYQLNARLHAPTRTRTVRMGAINFEGNSVSELAVPAAARGLDEWLGSTASDATLLGTPDYEPDGDLWICRQPPVAWFGLQVAPVFVNRITRSGDEVCVSIVEARSEILPGDGREEPGLVGRAVAAAMKRSSFSGRNRLSWRAHADGGWVLASDFELTLKVPLPRLLPLPLGFNRIGSAIVSRTCRQRVAANLDDLRDVYTAWAEAK